MSDEMKAGRELDALVAEKVMGMTWPADRCRVCGWTLAASAKEGCVDGNCSLRPAPTGPDGKARRADDPPPFSESISAAWQVVEHLHLCGNMVSVNASSRGSSSEWWCVVYLDRDAAGFIESEYYPTAPEAICHAALAVAAQPSPDAGGK